MDLFSRQEPLERVRDIAGEASAPATDRGAASSAGTTSDVRRIARPRRERQAAPDREPIHSAGGDGGRTALVLALSLGAHGLFAIGLAALPAASSMMSAATGPIAIEMTFEQPMPEPVVAPEPAIVPEPLPEPEPIATPRPRVVEPQRAVEPTPEPAAVQPDPEPAPAPMPSSAPPSLEDVFGAPPPPSAMTAEGGSGGAFAAGSPDGRAGGVQGGTGTGGGRGGAGAVPSGPSADDVRRARRAYASAIRELLAASARYPVAARAQRITGRVELALRIDAEGRLLAVRVVGSSGYPLLDDAAVATANELRTFPRPPDLVPWSAREEVRTSLVYALTR